jgi:hypothetical protein
MRKLLLIAALLSSTAAAAQQQPNAADRIAAQIGSLFIQVQQQQDMITSLQGELAKAQARVKELEAKAADK